jgi:hypothetical protein
MLDGIDISFSTVYRAENYLAATLESFAEDLPIGPGNPIRLVVGSPDASHLMPYRTWPGVEIIEMGPSVWGWIQNFALRHRATWNYYRCLTHNRLGRRGSLILEDDVQCARGWRARLEATIADLERRHGGDFVLSIYDPVGWQSDTNCCLCANYEPARFYGTQGVYFTAKTRAEFAKYLKRRGVVGNEGHYDQLLRDYALDTGQPIFACTPSLLQHRGHTTTGLGPYHHAPNFVDDVRGLPVCEERQQAV